MYKEMLAARTQAQNYNCRNKYSLGWEGFLFHIHSNKQLMQRWVIFYILIHVLTCAEKGENGKQANDSFLL